MNEIFTTRQVAARHALEVGELKAQIKASESKVEEVKASAMAAVDKFRALLKQHQQTAMEVSFLVTSRAGGKC